MKFILIFLSFYFLLTLFTNSQELPRVYEREKVYNENKQNSHEPDSIWKYTKANFRYAEFDSLTFFLSVKFVVKADFGHSKFTFLTSFSEVEFDSIADFSYAEFYSYAFFSEAKFDSIANFAHTNFDSLANFTHTEFDSTACFTYAKFAKKVDFSYANFDSIANFSGSKFLSEVFFQYAIFASGINLTYSQIEKDIKFDFATLPDTVLLEGATINGQLDFSYAKPKDSLHECKINFYNTNIDNLILDYSIFKMIYPDTVEEREVDKLFTDLLRVQEKHNFTEGYKKLDIEYKEYKAYCSSSNNLLSKAIFKIKEWWYNFGYNKEYIFKRTATLFGICLGVNWLLFQFFVLKIYCPKSLLNIKEKFGRYSVKNDKFLKLKTIPYAAYYTLIIFFGLKMDLENFDIKGDIIKTNWKKRLGVFWVFLTYFLGIVCTAYLANFIITR